MADALRDSSIFWVALFLWLGAFIFAELIRSRPDLGRWAAYWTLFYVPVSRYWLLSDGTKVYD